MIDPQLFMLVGGTGFSIASLPGDTLVHLMHGQISFMYVGFSIASSGLVLHLQSSHAQSGPWAWPYNYSR